MFLVLASRILEATQKTQLVQLIQEGAIMVAWGEDPHEMLLGPRNRSTIRRELFPPQIPGHPLSSRRQLVPGDQTGVQLLPSASNTTLSTPPPVQPAMPGERGDSV